MRKKVTIWGVYVRPRDRKRYHLTNVELIERRARMLALAKRHFDDADCVVYTSSPLPMSLSKEKVEEIRKLEDERCAT
jgi:hypothetical protein